ncbi:MAG: DinB family protein [Acidobacteriota bacterium]
MEEYTAVKVVQLQTSTRHVDGTAGVVRQPQFGDVGMIVHVNAPNKSYIVECVNSEGYTVWLADFDSEEIELLSYAGTSDRIETVTGELAKVADDTKEAFGALSVAQLNWKPAEKSWSVAQCFDHLITTHSLYFPLFEKLARGNVPPTFWEKHSPFSGYFGRFLIRSLDPKNQKKMKTTAKAFPSASEIVGDIIERFAGHQGRLIEYLRRLPADMDPAKQIITSPLSGVITYSLDDTFTILDVHCQRHFGQAKRVTETDGFPK